ncbi:hypothetical protein TcBrA4_0103170 [Trypanosoma cruzi]|nr:hypothetical protein TcBrA4_0103170 [Trypanosoma cruzi]
MQRAPRNGFPELQTNVKRRQRGCWLLTGAEESSPIHSTTHLSSHKASHRAADTSSDLSNRPNQSTRRVMELIRQRCSTVVRRTSDISALGQLHEESERGGSRDVCAVNVGAENVPGGAIHSLLLDARTADERGELRGLLAAIVVAPPTRRQHARMLRSILEMNRTPLDMVILGLKEIAARTETEQTHPSTEDEMNQVILSRTDWRERVVFRLAWITASRWSDIAALTPNNFTLERDGTVILDWSVAPVAARADPHRASRFVRIRGQDAFDTIKLCRTLRRNEKVTNLTTAHVEGALAP